MMTQTIPKQVWRDSYEQGTRNGEGVTYTTEPGASYFWVEVLMRGAPPMINSVRATSAEQAVQFCQARHPNAVLVRLRGEQ